MFGKTFGAPQVSRHWDWAILTHGNGRNGYYKNLVFLWNIVKCKQCSQQSDFGLRWGFHPPGQPSRKDKSTLRGRFLNFTLRALLSDVEWAFHAWRHQSLRRQLRKLTLREEHRPDCQTQRKYHFSWKTWNHPMAGTVILPVALWPKSKRILKTWHWLKIHGLRKTDLLKKQQNHIMLKTY
jgi:hypothetical protein